MAGKKGDLPGPPGNKPPTKATKPPYVVKFVGQTTLGSDGYSELKIGGSTFKVIQGSGKLVDGSKPIPDYAWGPIRRWVALNYYADSPDYQDPHLDKGIVLDAYCQGAAAQNPKSTYPHSPIESPLNAVTDIAGLIGKLTDPNFLLRVAEFIIGAILLGIGISHISGSAGETLRKIPVYGKVMPK